MSVSLQMHPLTVTDLRQMPDDGNRYELLHGELIVSPAPSLNHGRLSSALHALLANHVRSHGLGEVYTAPVEVQFSNHTKVQPDLLFIREDRIDLLDRGAEIVGAPDLVVEIISPSSRGRDRIRKAVAYTDAGVQEYWLVDPMERTFEIMTLDSGRYVPVASGEDGRVASLVFPGLVVDPQALFARLRP